MFGEGISGSPPDPAFAFEGRGQKVASEKVEQARRSCGIEIQRAPLCLALLPTRTSGTFRYGNGSLVMMAMLLARSWGRG